jgi:hypothetical protein
MWPRHGNKSSSGGGNGRIVDPNERYAHRKCCLYLSRYIAKRGRVDKPDLELLTWVLGPEMDRLLAFLIDSLDLSPDDSAIESLMDCRIDPDDCPGAIIRTLSIGDARLQRRFVKVVQALLGEKVRVLGRGGQSQRLF